MKGLIIRMCFVNYYPYTDFTLPPSDLAEGLTYDKYLINMH